ncbi:unnamed protein product [Cylindrotheca closterium]|uniref:SET domain-containing protein n=1 Tax=Cylindrotheca closterium TaxID=2856 RepID=A0AAD2CMI9_9STRA|nr:unnamed protein product [Cylindrotheca closterium]
MPSSLLPIAPELSRSFKYQEYARHNCDSNRPIRKAACNQEGNQISSEQFPSDRCFEVRPSTNGVGMFAIKEIAIGDIIIDSEAPIVSTSLSLFPATTRRIMVAADNNDGNDRIEETYVEKVNDTTGSHKEAERQDEENNVGQYEDLCYERSMLKPPFCQTCGTPIGNLRQDHLKAPLHLELPGIEKSNVGLVFTFDKRDGVDGKTSKKIPEQDEDKDCKEKVNEDHWNSTCQTFRSPYHPHVAWCSQVCWERGYDLHAWLCCIQKVPPQMSQEHRKKLKTTDKMSKHVDHMANNTNKGHQRKEPSSESSRRLQKFLEERDNPKIFELAVHAALLVLSLTFREEHRKERSAEQEIQNQKTPSYNYLWWEDYGSHPFWWAIGAKENRKDRFDSAQEFADILRDWSEERIFLMKGIEKERYKQGTGHGLGKKKRRRPQLESSHVSSEATVLDANSTDYRHKILLSPDGISVNNIGALLGMLQCNVMEFSYPSPLEQYMEQAEQFMDEEHLAIIESSSSADCHDESTNDHDDDETDQVDTTRHSEWVLGCRWLRKKYWNGPIKEEDAQSNESCALDNGMESSPEPVVGSGLYPLLTLANHHCNPNASIEFLRESNLGSMIALRSIKPGEEICITYVPNGRAHLDLEDQNEGGNDQEVETKISAGTERGVGNTHDGDYFKHFEPTQTWKWLNNSNREEDGDESDDDDGYDSSGSGSHHEDASAEEGYEMSPGDRNDLSSSDQQFAGDEKPDGQSASSELEDGSNPRQRAMALLEYGFICACARCENEKKQEQH